jgi:methylmalonyl-CoA mutase cobalamin-binding subunit
MSVAEGPPQRVAAPATLSKLRILIAKPGLDGHDA